MSVSLRAKNFLRVIIYKLYIIIYILAIGIPLLLLIRIVSPFVLIRWMQLRSNTIGHYTVNTELYLCERDKKINNPSINFFDFFYLNPGKKTCNNQLTLMWKRKIKILPWQILRGIDILNKIIPGGSKHNIYTSSTYATDVNNLLDKTKVHLQFTTCEEQEGKRFLKSVGLKDHDKFVCLIVRDSAYHENLYGKKMFDYHSYRNCDVNNFVKACNFLTSKGLYIFRMGKYVNSRFNIDNDKVIDYASNGMRNDFLDIYLGSKCLFWISTNTGIDGLSQIFRIPALFVNQVPLATTRTTHSNSILILKHLYDKSKKKKISIKEIIKKKLEFSLRTEEFEKKNIVTLENTQDEICDAAEELYEMICEKKDFLKKNENLQKEFWKLFPYNKNLHGEIKTIISPSFLKNNLYLLE